MRRRNFIKMIGGAAFGWPLAVRAQEPGRVYRLAFVVPSPRQGPATIAFFDELRRNGFIEGQNLAVVPNGFDGGNITGVSLLSPELDTKRQEILIEAVPGARKIAAMADANAAPEYHLQALEHAARSRGVELSVFRVGGSGEITSAIDAAKASGAEALNFLATPLFSVPGSQNNRVVLDRVAAVRLPSIFQFPETAEAGALAGYGARITDLYRQRARITLQVLRGTKPSDIPVQQPDKFELVINLKVAKAIGVEVPATLVARADKLIDERT